MTKFIVEGDMQKVGFRSKIVEANSIHGFKSSDDSYVFKNGQKIVAVFPKNGIKSISRQEEESSPTED